MVVFGVCFYIVKDEVNVELVVFVGDLVGVFEDIIDMDFYY